MPARAKHMPAAGAKMASEPLRSIASGRRHPRCMTLYAANGSSFSWQLAHSADGGFDASFCFERRVDGEPHSERGALHVLGGDIAQLWLRAEAAVRGFDGRGVK